MVRNEIPKHKELYYAAHRTWDKYKPKSLYQEVKWFIQRGRRGWSDRDWWSTDYYLGEILPDMLRKYVKDGIGYPAGFGGSSDAKSIASLDEADDEEWERQAASWHKALLEAADDIEAYFKFENDLDNYPKDVHDKDAWEKHRQQHDVAMGRTTKGMQFVADHFYDLWD